MLVAATGEHGASCDAPQGPGSPGTAARRVPPAARTSVLAPGAASTHAPIGDAGVTGKSGIDRGGLGADVNVSAGFGGVGGLRSAHAARAFLRILMRQEKTMKVIINHAIDPRISLEPNAGSDRSWVWSAFDFAEGELVETVFALRFADSDIAGSFKDGFLQAQEEMEKVLAGEDAADTGAGDEAAEALAGLTTGEKEGDKEGGEVEEAAEAEAEAKEE